jgi:hypothetical protein
MHVEADVQRRVEDSMFKGNDSCPTSTRFGSPPSRIAFAAQAAMSVASLRFFSGPMRRLPLNGSHALS